MANIHDINRDEWMLRGPLAKKAMTGGGIQAKLWAENAVQYNRITIMQIRNRFVMILIMFVQIILSLLSMQFPRPSAESDKSLQQSRVAR